MLYTHIKKWSVKQLPSSWKVWQSEYLSFSLDKPWVTTNLDGLSLGICPLYGSEQSCSHVTDINMQVPPQECSISHSQALTDTLGLINLLIV